MNQSNIAEQAKKYAEVITEQIIDNFDALATTVEKCKELKEVKEKYNNLSLEDNMLMDIDKVKERLEIIENHIGDVVCDGYNSVEPLAVGLFGEWGSGKTYQLKLIKKHLSLYNKEKDEKKKAPVIIPVFFNAWRFEKEEHIIIPLFQILLDAVEHHERSLGEKVGRSLKSTAYHLKNVLFALHHGISWSSTYKTVRGALTNNIEDMREVTNILNMEEPNKKAKEKTNKEQVGKQTLSELITPDQLESIYLNIPQWIEKITLFENVNFVFLIDDLDRCLPENTLKMLESIKLFLDVPSCAFVLAVDDDVVERGVVHHYRDYLSIYHSNDTEGAQGVLQHELPITGHEYLEKMIQLPIRLPVIDTVNVRAFLEEHSGGWISIVDKKYNEELEEERKGLTAPSERLLDFFAKTIPPKPRKIKRTALLFESKLKLLEGLSYDMMLVAKITLLELFAPKLLRYIQNNGYTIIYNRLCHFREVEYFLEQEGLSEDEREEENTDEILLNDLSEVKNIEKYIKRSKEKDPSAYTQKEQNVLLKLMSIVEEHYSSRITFDLDHIFTEKIDASKLKMVIEMREEQHKTTVNRQKPIASFDRDTLQRLFRSGDTDAWREALAERDAMIDSSGLAVLIEKAQEEKDTTFNDLPFIANPEWVGIVAEYLDEPAYLVLLNASHDERFKTAKNLNFEIDMFQMTFAEYDKYCELTNKEKPKDYGWGRGRRPVIYVNWNDADEYIKWINNKNIGIYKLPTSTEWSLACNHKKENIWYFGDSAKMLHKYAWYVKNSDGKTHPVGILIANNVKLYDMYGNVWEWCEDWEENQYGDTEVYKMINGGSWSGSAELTRNKRFRNYPEISNDNIGFRLQRSLRS